MNSPHTDPLNSNPYRAPASEIGINAAPQADSKFPFFTAGPILGTIVGLAHVVSQAMVWAFHGFPDFFFRTAEWVLIAAVLMAIGGGLLGLAYGSILSFFFRTYHLQLKLRFHNSAAVLASLLITAVTSEVGLQRGRIVSPLFEIAAIVACAFAAALATARRF